MKIMFYKLMMLVVVLALGLTACASQQEAPAQDDAPVAPIVSADAVVAEGHLKPVQAVNLTFQVRGIVELVEVKIGDPVSKGDVLARLSNASQAEAQLTAANIELLHAQQDLDTLNRTADSNRAAAWDAYQKAQIVRADAQKEWDDVNPREIQNRVDDQQATVNDRKQDLEDAQDEFDKYKDLDIDNSRRIAVENDLRSAQRDYDDAIAELEEIQRESDSVRAALDAALAAEAEAKYQWDLSLDGANKDQLALAQSRLDNAQAQAAAAESVLGNSVLTAPFDGIIADVAIVVGEQVGAESRALSIVDTTSWVVETSDITELEVVDIRPGQTVTIVADALPEVSMEGIVTAVSQSSFTQSGDVLYTVYIEMTAVDARVKWGMTVEVTFEPMN